MKNYLKKILDNIKAAVIQPYPEGSDEARPFVSSSCDDRMVMPMASEKFIEVDRQYLSANSTIRVNVTKVSFDRVYFRPVPANGDPEPESLHPAIFSSVFSLVKDKSLVL